MSFHSFKNEDSTEYGSFEVFYEPDDWTCGDDTYEAGWYWWACVPGCLPDSEYPNGPFQTHLEALTDAQENP